jgi:hypothetical protein
MKSFSDRPKTGWGPPPPGQLDEQPIAFDRQLRRAEWFELQAPTYSSRMSRGRL